jgi:hypothetical protein
MFIVIRQHYHCKNLKVGDSTNFRIGDNICMGTVIARRKNVVIIVYPIDIPINKWIGYVQDTSPV